MLRFELFDETKTYMFPNGEVATPGRIRQQFPAVDQFPHILELNGPVVQAVISLDAARSMHNIDSQLSVEDAIAEIEYIVNNPPPPEPSPEERIASSLEFQNIMMLPDVEIE